MPAKKPDGWDLPYKFRQRLDKMLPTTSQAVWSNGGKREYVWWKKAAKWGFVREEPASSTVGLNRYAKFVRTLKMIEVGLPAVYGFYFLPEHRQVLASWPAGAVRDIEVFSNNLNKKLWEEGEGEGYYEILEEIDDTHLTIKRTYKPMRPYKSRTLAMPQPFDGVWPWKPAIHWERMKSNPIRKSQEVTRQFTGKRSDFRLHILYPTVIRELGTLRKVRDDLEKVFLGVPTGWRSSSHLTDRFLGNGVTARILFLDLMAEPTFDNNGKFLNFAELSAEQVQQEYNILGGGTGDDAVAKYKNFMREYSWIP